MNDKLGLARREKYWNKRNNDGKIYALYNEVLQMWYQLTQDEIIEMSRHIANTFGRRMCEEHGDTYGEELYAMDIDDIVETITLVAAAEREACARAIEETHMLYPQSLAARIRERGEK